MKIKTTNTIIVFPNKNILSGLWKNKDSFLFYPENSSSEGLYVKLSTWNHLVLFDHLLKKAKWKNIELLYDKLSSDIPCFLYRNPQTHVPYKTTESQLRFPDLSYSFSLLHPGLWLSSDADHHAFQPSIIFCFNLEYFSTKKATPIRYTYYSKFLIQLFKLLEKKKAKLNLRTRGIHTRI